MKAIHDCLTRKLGERTARRILVVVAAACCLILALGAPFRIALSVLVNTVRGVVYETTDLTADAVRQACTVVSILVRAWKLP